MPLFSAANGVVTCSFFPAFGVVAWLLHVALAYMLEAQATSRTEACGVQDVHPVDTDQVLLHFCIGTFT